MVTPHHTMTEPRHVMPTPQYIMMKPHNVMTKPQYITTQLKYNVTKLHHITIKHHHLQITDYIRKLWLSIEEHEPSVFIFANSLFWRIIFSFTSLYGLINLYVLYRKRNIDLLVSHFALKRNLVTRKCCPG